MYRNPVFNNTQVSTLLPPQPAFCDSNKHHAERFWARLQFSDYHLLLINNAMLKKSLSHLIYPVLIFSTPDMWVNSILSGLIQSIWLDRGYKRIHNKEVFTTRVKMGFSKAGFNSRFKRGILPVENRCRRLWMELAHYFVLIDLKMIIGKQSTNRVRILMGKFRKCNRESSKKADRIIW